MYNPVARIIKPMFCRASEVSRGYQGRGRTYRCDVSKVFVLLYSATDGDEEQQHPRYPNFREHFEVYALPVLTSERKHLAREQPRVQTGTHKDIIHCTPRHPDRFPTIVEHGGQHVNEERGGETDDDTPTHERAKGFDEPGKAEEAGEVERGGEEEGGVE